MAQPIDIPKGSPLPDHSSPSMSFNVLQTQTKISDALLGPRISKLKLPKRPIIHTPHFISHTSRGVIPHLSQDVTKAHTDTKGLYVAVEDFLEQLPKTPPIYKQPAPNNERLKAFISAHDDLATILSPRRVPPIECSGHTTDTSIQICASVGFRALDHKDYVEAAERLRPDIVVGMADVPNNPGVKRMDRMVSRTHKWTEHLVNQLYAETVHQPPPCIVAPILPLDSHQQDMYLDSLKDEMNSSRRVSGLSFYTPSSVAAIPKELILLPRFLLNPVPTPVSILHSVGLSFDVFVVPFINDSSDNGIALTFSFPVMPVDTDHSKPLVLGDDMWDKRFEKDLNPLSFNCRCYTCMTHHRAYVHHLLKTKEMLGWTLLQIHNNHIMERFFHGIRQSIRQGRFDSDVKTFERCYETFLPLPSGIPPRQRGYQFKSGTGDPKKNPKAYNKLDDAANRIAESEEVRPFDNPTGTQQDIENMYDASGISPELPGSSPPEPTVFNFSPPKKSDQGEDLGQVDVEQQVSSVIDQMGIHPSTRGSPLQRIVTTPTPQTVTVSVTVGPVPPEQLTSGSPAPGTSSGVEHCGPETQLPKAAKPA